MQGKMMAQGLVISFVSFTWLMASYLFVGVQSKVWWRNMIAIILLCPISFQFLGVLPLNLQMYSFFVVVISCLVLREPGRFCQGILWVVFLLFQACMTLFLLQMLASLNMSTFWLFLVLAFSCGVLALLHLFNTRPTPLPEVEDVGVLLLILGVLGSALPGFLASWENSQRLFLVERPATYQLGPGLGFIGLVGFVVLILGFLFQLRKDKK